MNRYCSTGINDRDFHYAVYEKVVITKGIKTSLKITAAENIHNISYLNANWLEEDGGQLFVFHNDASQKILPRAKTALFFKSEELDQEVTKTNRSRMSIEGG